MLVQKYEFGKSALKLHQKSMSEEILQEVIVPPLRPPFLENPGFSDFPGWKPFPVSIPSISHQSKHHYWTKKDMEAEQKSDAIL